MGIDAIFFEKLVKKMNELFGKGYSFSIQETPKNNGISVNTLGIHCGQTEMVPFIYLENYNKQYNDGTPLDEIANDIYFVYQRSQKNKKTAINQLNDFSSLKDKIIYYVIGTQKNQEMLKKRPHKRFGEDLAIVFAVLVVHQKKGLMTMHINDTHMKVWDTTIEELFQLAERNTPRLLPITLMNIEDVLWGLAVQEPESREKQEKIRGLMGEKDNRHPLYVLSNTTGLYGAASILYPGVMKQAAKKIGEELLILPSSIHEVLVLAYDEIFDVDEIAEIVQIINLNEVSPEDVLSNSVYFYSKVKGIIKQVANCKVN